MADAQDSEETAHDIQSKIEGAMRTRAHFFKQVADSMTVVEIRRLLEKDLEMQIYALDVHKAFIKDWLLEFLDAAANDNASDNFGEAVKNNVCSVTVDSKMPEKCSPKKDLKETKCENADVKKDSPVLGLNDTIIKENLNETMIQNAIKKRESYIKDNSVSLSKMGIRRLLEEDLKLDKYTLDPHKKFISKEIEVVMLTKSSVEDEVKPKKSFASKGEPKNSERLKKRKMHENEANTSIKMQTKQPNNAAEGNSADRVGNVSEDCQLQSSTEKTIKKEDVQLPAYGKYVERLRSVIKLCGMSVPPHIYKKPKDVPENKRKACLISELEKILLREGLSPNPSEKEIKKVKEKKDRAEELKGIDMSNILPCSRRRSTTSSVTPPKPQEPDENDDEHSEHYDDEDSEDNDGSQSDEVDEENDEKSESF